jgi:hypothetical protein
VITLLADPEVATPLELHDGMWYKRDDLLAFSNGVNGKVRTSLYLARHAKKEGFEGLVYGGSVHAPALGRVASAAAYEGLGCELVIGSDPNKAIRHDTVRVAVEAGAHLVRCSVAYNPALQKLARETALYSGGAIFQVPYGVSTPDEWTPDQVRGFLEEDAWQVEDLIDEGIETLVIPFGSGNAAAGILYGLATRGYGDIERVVLVGVGPDRREWLMDRLRYVDVGHGGDLPDIEYLPLHPHFAEYGDRMPETRDGIDFHPTYEGKVVRFLDVLRPTWWTARDGKTCMWIVGGKP